MGNMHFPDGLDDDFRMQNGYPRDRNREHRLGAHAEHKFLPRWSSLGKASKQIVLVGERHESVLPLARMNRDEGSCRPALVQVPKTRPETLALPFRWEHAENHFHERQQR